MKRTPMTRSTPMSRGTIPLRRAAMKKRKPKARAGQDKTMLTACRGQQCWLAIPGVCRGDIATVVPCHSNQGTHGKGMGIKARDEYTVPGCMHCHSELDQGRLFSREEKASLWNAAFERWQPVRDGVPA